MDKTVLIVQARMGSKRLPGKSLLPLCGEPMLGRILERLKRCVLADEIVLAIPSNSMDDPLACLARRYGVGLYRGSEDDVLGRYYHAARQNKASTIVRFPADNPVPEPSEIDRIIEHHKELPIRGFSSNLSPFWSSAYPDGIGAEVFDTDILEYAYINNHKPCQREHVHLNFFDYSLEKPINSTQCPVSTIPCPTNFRRPDLILDVNTQDQYRYISELYESLYPLNPFFSITDIINWHDSRALH